MEKQSSEIDLKKSLTWYNISKTVPFILETSALNIFLTKLEYSNFKNLKKKTHINLATGPL